MNTINTMTMIQDRSNKSIDKSNKWNEKNKYNAKLHLNYIVQNIVNFTNIMNNIDSSLNLMNQNISLSNSNSIDISN